ncbi:MAG: NRDE family protein [Candidatus Pelagadaptatus aseana]|uniref:NRDE family protein n=1 Tax=Candidatus Pelagadaptatus aseana TaxID=3120508 RepID=UPI0039B1CB1C
MCLILFALQQHPDFPLIVAANRDEFFARPTRPASFWPDHPELYAGLDLEAGGTWLGINRSGQFSALTNFREPGSIQTQSQKASRGELPSHFLMDPETRIESYFSQLQASRHHYNGYNLLCGSPQQLGYYSNRGEADPRLQEGIYGLSNGLINTPWPKVATGKQALADTLKTTSPDPDQLALALFELLGCSEQAPDHQLPDTGVGLEWERTLSPRFIRGDVYGTRTSTVVLFSAQGPVRFFERNFNEKAEVTSQSFELLNPD